jgi:hypothetical protein
MTPFGNNCFLCSVADVSWRRPGKRFAEINHWAFLGRLVGPSMRARPYIAKPEHNLHSHRLGNVQEGRHTLYVDVDGATSNDDSQKHFYLFVIPILPNGACNLWMAMANN